MIDSGKVLYSSGDNDECYTPPYGVQPILKYIPKDVKVWCPFDKAESEFVKQISQTHSVEYSHIDEGKDFFTYEPYHWDVMFDSRMKFISPDGRPNDKITFSSSYYCWNFLPKQIIMEKLHVPKEQQSRAVLPV